MRILIVAPHADDETLGCGGLIARRANEGHRVDIVVVTVGDVRRGGELKSTAAQRRQELRAAAEQLGASEPQVLFDGYENRLDQLPQLDVVSALDQRLGETAYDQVFIPYASHHQDHQLVFRACHAALREKDRPGPGLIALYEYPYVGWAVDPIPGGRYYVDISDTFDQKIAALKAYQSQTYDPPHPISWESVEALARIRGVESSCRYAELFYLLKMVEGPRAPNAEDGA